MSPTFLVRGALVLTPGLVLLGAASVLRHGLLALQPGEWPPPRLVIYLTGCVAFSLGIKLFLDAGLGVDPLHAMTLGIVDLVNRSAVGVGLVDASVTLILLSAWMVWNRRLPPLSTFVTMALAGFLVDLWNLVYPPAAGPVLPAPAALLLGLLLYAYGSALIIMSGIGIRIVDLLALTIVRELRWRFYRAKLVIEAGFLLGGLLSGGPIGLATVAFLAAVGPFVEPMIWANRRYLNLPDCGLRPVMRRAMTEW